MGKSSVCFATVCDDSNDIIELFAEKQKKVLQTVIVWLRKQVWFVTIVFIGWARSTCSDLMRICLRPTVALQSKLFWQLFGGFFSRRLPINSVYFMNASFFIFGYFVWQTLSSFSQEWSGFKFWNLYRSHPLTFKILEFYRNELLRMDVVHFWVLLLGI